MKEKLVERLEGKLEQLNVFIDDVFVTKENNETTLTIVLDREDDYIDLKTVVQATRILNPIVDELNFIESEYTLDVYAKEKGEEKHEQ